MLRDKPKSLSELIGSTGSPLGSLAAEASRREALSDYLRSNLPPELEPGFLHCNLTNEGLLVVLASSPEWAARLRFEADTFRRLCDAHGVVVTDVRVRVGGG